MIVDLIVTLLFGVLNAVLGLIPEFTVFDPGGLFHSETLWASAVGEWLALWDLFWPVGIFFECLLAVLAARVFVVVVQFVHWVWSVLPFKSS